jgi:general stress protein 26
VDWLPGPVRELVETALVAELTVVDADGRPVTYPLIPLYEDGRIYMSSSSLFSRKLEHLRDDPRVAVSVTDPIATGGRADRTTIQGDARLLEDDPHTTWERILPLWRQKEPAIEAYYKMRFGIPLYFERSLIEITPRRALYWSDGRADSTPEVSVAPEVSVGEPVGPTTAEPA